MATGTLTGTTIASTYKSLLRIGSGSSADNTVLDADLQIVEDGDGNNSCLQLSTDQVLVKDASGTDVASCFEVQDKDGTVCLSVNGSTNYVGIGTATPLSEGTGQTLHIAETDNTNEARLVISGGSGSGGAAIGSIQFADPTHSGGAGAETVASIIGSVVGDHATPGGELAFYTQVDGGDGGAGANTFAMKIDAAQRVGIGTSSPGSLLEVRGSTGTGAASAGVLTLSTAETTVRVGTVDQLGRIDFQAPVEGGGTDAILVGASIWAECEEDFSSSNNSTALVFATGTTATASEQMRIDQDGLVGIGTAAPSIKLTVTESASARVASFVNSHAAAPYGILIDYSNDDPNGAGNSFIDCDDSSATRFAVLSNGQIKSVVHYDTAAGATQEALYVDDSGFFGKVTSLREHKKKISDMEDISWLYNVRPVNFEYKVRETEERINRKGKSEQWPTGKWLNEADGIKQYGLIAEELEEVSGAESLLSYYEDELSGISYHKFVPILIKAVQELSAKVTALENA